jgi:hypothetical protein
MNPFQSRASGMNKSIESMNNLLFMISKLLHKYNYDLINELNRWARYLTENNPRVFTFKKSGRTTSELKPLLGFEANGLES